MPNFKPKKGESQEEFKDRLDRMEKARIKREQENNTNNSLPFSDFGRPDRIMFERQANLLNKIDLDNQLINVKPKIGESLEQATERLASMNRMQQQRIQKQNQNRSRDNLDFGR